MCCNIEKIHLVIYKISFSAHLIIGEIPGIRDFVWFLFAFSRKREFWIFLIYLSARNLPKNPSKTNVLPLKDSFSRIGIAWGSSPHFHRYQIEIAIDHKEILYFSLALKNPPQYETCPSKIKYFLLTATWLLCIALLRWTALTTNMVWCMNLASVFLPSMVKKTLLRSYLLCFLYHFQKKKKNFFVFLLREISLPFS